MDWQMRREARHALRVYPRLKRKQAEAAGQQITPEYGGVVVQHGASRTTEDAALRSTLTADELRIIEAVEMAVAMQERQTNGAERLKMIRLVYWQRTHTLAGAAIECHYSVEALKRWANEIQAAVWIGLKGGVAGGR